MATLIAKEAAHGPAALHGTRAGQLAAYITDPHKCGDDDMRSANLYATTVEDAAREMAAICDAADGTGKRKLIQHWIISTRREGKEDHPANGEIMAAGRELMAALGYAKCPHMIAIHNNTDNRHAHIVVARVDADTGQIVHDSHTHIKAQKAVATISAAHGWRPERGNMWQIAPDGEIVTRAKAERDKPRRGNIRTSTADDTITPATPRQTLEERLAAFADDTRGQWAAWKWGDLHKALALRGIEMQYTDRGNGRGGLAYSADGKTWIKASSACPEMTYPALSAALGAKAGSYRKARAGIAKIVADARALRQQPTSPAPTEATQKPAERQEVAQTQGAPRAPEKEEKKTMTDAQIQYLALLARERADAQTRTMLDAMGKAANIDFYRQNEAILQKLHESKYTDADAYARLMYNAARYHLRRVAADAASQRRDEDETRRNRRQYATFRAHAKRHATAGQDPRRIAAIMMYRAGAKVGKIAALMVDGMLAEAEAEKSNFQQICDQIEDIIADTMDAMIADMLRDRTQAEKLDAEIAKIEDAYADMSLHAPAEYREGMEERKQEAIAAAQALDEWRQELEARKAQRQPGEPSARRYMGIVGEHAGPSLRRRMRGIDADDMPAATQTLIRNIAHNIDAGQDNAEKYAILGQHLAEIHIAQETDPKATPTAADATIYQRHAARAEAIAEPGKIRDMIALRLRTCGHNAGDAVRIMRAGMDINAAMGAAAYIYHTDRGDDALRRAEKYAEQWRREERGEQQIRRNGGATQAQRPAPAAAAAPRM